MKPKLTPEQVRYIRRMRAKQINRPKLRELSDLFGVNTTSIRNAEIGKNYRWVSTPQSVLQYLDYLNPQDQNGPSQSDAPVDWE